MKVEFLCCWRGTYFCKFFVVRRVRGVFCGIRLFFCGEFRVIVLVMGEFVEKIDNVVLRVFFLVFRFIIIFIMMRFDYMLFYYIKMKIEL